MDLEVKAPELEYIGGYDAMLKPPLETGGPFGPRMIIEIIGGEFRAWCSRVIPAGCS